MPLDDHLTSAKAWFDAGDPGRALHLFQQCPPGLDVDVGIAKCLLKLGQGREACYQLIRLYYKYDVTGHDRECVAGLLQQVADEVDDELARAIAENLAPTKTRKASTLLKHFYFGGARLRDTLAQTVFRRKGSLHSRSDRTITSHGTWIEFAKSFSSYTVLRDLAPPGASGGGYFINFRGYGCVVDPGHHFLANFYHIGHTIADIDCIIITHFHDDHYADLPALLSLLHQRWARRDQVDHRKVDLFLDHVTYHKFRPIFERSDYVYRKSPLRVGDQPIDLANGIRLRTLPTQHPVLDEDTGVGLEFQIDGGSRYLVITGDTAWFPALHAEYSNYAGKNTHLVAHVSSAWSNEAVETLTGNESFYPKHLCIHGLGKLIETAQPRVVLLSEIGEELTPVVYELAGLVAKVFGVECKVGNLQMGPHYFL